MQKRQRLERRSGIEQRCLDRGLRMTEKRRIIARVLSNANDHPSADEVYRRAQLIDETISVATVYRTIRILDEQGILQRRDFGSGRARYEPADNGHHNHLIEVDTGKVLEFSDMAHDQLLAAVVEGLGFQIVSVRLEVFARRLHLSVDTRDPTPSLNQITERQRATEVTTGSANERLLPPAVKFTTQPLRRFKPTAQK